MQFEAVACRLFLHYSYTLAQKASNYGIFCFYNKNKSKALSIRELAPLYWIQKDLSESESVCITNPNSTKLAKMRNDMVHNALRTVTKKVEIDLKFTNTVFREEIENNTLELLKLLRECIISLVIAVHTKQQKDICNRN